VNPEITENLTGIMSLQPQHSGQLRFPGLRLLHFIDVRICAQYKIMEIEYASLFAASASTWWLEHSQRGAGF
jgi:hypothetical protein